MHPIHSAISVYQGITERILLDVISSIKLFDSLHESDNEYKEKLQLDVNLYCYDYM